MLAYGICLSLSDLLHSVGQTLGPSCILKRNLGDFENLVALHGPQHWASRSFHAWLIRVPCLEFPSASSPGPIAGLGFGGIPGRTGVSICQPTCRERKAPEAGEEFRI